MLTSIQALNYRSLRFVETPLDAFHVLVGPNASGKTTFLDVVAFLGKLVADGLEAAIWERSRNFSDLLWGRQGDAFELAIEAQIPERLRGAAALNGFDTIRYEVGIGWDEADRREIGIRLERVLLKASNPPQLQNPGMFPASSHPPRSLSEGKAGRDSRLVMNKVAGGNDNFYSETYKETGKGWVPSFKLGPRKSTLGNLPEDESKFPVSTWLKSFLTEGVQQLNLNSLLIRQPSPPGLPRGFRADGSNLPWVIWDLERQPAGQDHLAQWVAHLQTAFPDIEQIKTVERPEDHHRYLVVRYRGGIEVPSWMVSDGTLRILALTLLAYLPSLAGVYLIEEPENGIHPRAIETLFQSLSSVYASQILVATHSPVILSLAQAEQVLCFAKTDEGATDIVRGDRHPALAQWKGETNLGVLFAAGVLG
jgi:predicted ATPase